MNYEYLNKAINHLKQADALCGQILDKVVGDILETSSGDASILKREIKSVRQNVQVINGKISDYKEKISKIEPLIKQEE